MSTRSAVGVPQADGSFKGRYVHSDGYPTGVGRDLQALVLRDGYQTVVDTIVSGNNYSWSYLDVNGAIYERDEDRFGAVPGYGMTHTDVTESNWVTEDDDWGTEWLYVLGETGIDVLQAEWNKAAKKIGHVRYDDAEGMEKIEKEVYAAS
jgi:hypothetical protein